MLELTRQEKKVILFLLATGLLGIGILCYKSLRYRPEIEVISNQRIDEEAAESKIININTASTDDLIRLPGIGPAIAQAVIGYRNIHGAFQDKEDIKNVSGIGQAKFDTIKEYIKTE